MDIPLFKVYMNKDAGQAAKQVINSGYIGQGEVVSEFEKKLQIWFKHPHVLTLNNGTSGLHLALHMLKDEGGKVLTSPLTCTATNWPVLANSLDIEWVDVDPNTLNMDLDDLARKITKETKIILLVHWGGNPIDLYKVNEVLQQSYSKFGFAPKIVEDCAHSFGTKFGGQYLGNHGNICIYSMQAIKHVTAVDGGLLLLPTIEQYQRAKLLRWYGLDRETDKKDMRCEIDIEEYGFKFHMNDVNAAVGMKNLEDAYDIINKHQANGHYYNVALKNVEGVELIEVHPEADSAYWLYTIKVENRSAFTKHMENCGIQVSRVHERNDIHSCVIPYRKILPGLDSIMDKYICVYGHTRVQLTDGRKLPIKEIVNKRLEVNVISFNNRLKKIESNKIIGWYKSSRGDRKFVRISCEGSKNSGGPYAKTLGAWLTEDHLVLTPNGYVRSDSIVKGDLVYTNEIDLNEKQKSFIAGSLLGDGSISKYRFILGHGSKQQQYFEIKSKFIEPECINIYHDIKRGGFQFKTLRANIWVDLYKKWYPNGVKVVPNDLKDDINEFCLAIWYMDDGHLHEKEVGLCSQSFTKEENEYLIGILKEKFDINAKLRKVRPTSKGNMYKIVMGVGRNRESERFLELVAPYVIPSMRYKLMDEVNKRIPFNSELWKFLPTINYKICKVEDVEIKDSPKSWYKVETVYCIDVEDNHNFIAGNIIVHNCIPVGWWVTNKDRKYIADCIKKGW